MDYITQCVGGINHDDFYTNPDAIKAFKDYISHVLNRENKLTGVKYLVCLIFIFFTKSNNTIFISQTILILILFIKEDPTIFGWELANEPRCEGSNLPTSGSCSPDITTAWVDEISSYIKSIDSNHLVGVGDEGFFNKPDEAE